MYSLKYRSSSTICKKNLKIFILTKNRNFKKLSYIYPKQNFLKYFYIYPKQEFLKIYLYTYQEKILHMTGSQSSFNYSLFVKRFYFSILYNIFFHTQLAFFSSSGKTLYCSQSYCHFFLFLLRKNLDSFHEPFFCFIISG